MLIGERYPWSENFQLRVLAALVKQPGLIDSYIKPHYFTSPILVDVARIVSEIRKRHPDVVPHKVTLQNFVEASLGRDKMEEVWPLCKKVIERIYRGELGDVKILMEEAIEFAREAQYRQTLVLAERDVSNRRYDSVHKRFDELRRSSNGQPSKFQLPVYPHYKFLSTELPGGDELWRVQGLIPWEGAVLAFGLPKSLKSYSSLAIAVDASCGRDVLGHFQIECPVKTMVVQVEDPTPETKERLKFLLEQQGTKQPYPGMLSIVPRCSFKLSSPEWVAAFGEELEKRKPELVVFDVLRRLFVGNVNNPEEVSKFLNTLDDLRNQYKFSTILTHHANKRDDDDMRLRSMGSINLTAWPDVILYFDNKRQEGNKTICDLEIDGRSIASQEKLMVVLDEDHVPAVRVETRQKPGVLLARESLPGVWTVTEFAEVLNMDVDAARKKIKLLVEDGLVSVVKEGKRHVAGRYKFTAAG